MSLALVGLATAAAPLVASAFKSPAEKQAERLAAEQKARVQQLRGTLGERPEMDARVNRLNQLMSGNLGITDAERQMAETNINRSLSQGTSGVSSLGGGLRQLGAMTQGAGDAFGNMAAESSRMEQANTLNLGQQLASAEGEAEMFNDIQPYMEQLAEIQALIGASEQNQYLAALTKSDRINSLFEGIGGLGSSLMGAAGDGMTMADFGFGGGNSGGVKRTPTVKTRRHELDKDIVL